MTQGYNATILKIEEVVCKRISSFLDQRLPDNQYSNHFFLSMKSNFRNFVRPRQACWWLLYNNPMLRKHELSMTSIAKYYDFNHSTVSAAVARFTHMIIDKPASYEVAFLVGAAAEIAKTTGEFDVMNAATVRKLRGRAVPLEEKFLR